VGGEFGRGNFVAEDAMLGKDGGQLMVTVPGMA